jgi:hypothetical protein
VTKLSCAYQSAAVAWACALGGAVHPGRVTPRTDYIEDKLEALGAHYKLSLSSTTIPGSAAIAVNFLAHSRHFITGRRPLSGELVMMDNGDDPFFIGLFLESLPVIRLIVFKLLADGVAEWPSS